MGAFKLIATKNDIDNIKHLWEAGKTLIEIGKLYNVSQGPIARVLSENGVKLKNCPSESEIVEMVQMWEKGVKIKEIANNLGYNKATIRNKLKINGFKLSVREIEPRNWSTEEINQIIQLRNNGSTRREIMAKMNCNLGQLRYAINKFELENVRTNIHRWTDEETNRLIELRKEHLTIEEISELLNIPWSCIASKLDNLKITIRTDFWKNEDIDRLKQLVDQNKNLIEISLILDRSYNSLCAKVRSLKLNPIEQKIKNNEIRRCEIKESALASPNLVLNKKHKHLIIKRLKTLETRSRKKKISFELNLTDIENLWASQMGKCYYSNIPMAFFGYHYVWSVDRLNSKLGYTIDNIVLCLNLINKMKNDLDVNDFIGFCQIISKINLNNPAKNQINVSHE